MKPHVLKHKGVSWHGSEEGGGAVFLDAVLPFIQSARITGVPDAITGLGREWQTQVYALAEPAGGEPVTQRAEEAEFVEAQIKTGFLGFFSAPAVYEPVPSTQNLADAISKHTERLTEVCERLGRVEDTLRGVVSEIEQVRARDRGVWVPIDSFAPEPHELLRPITAVVTQAGDEFEASFFGANLYGSGDTEEEAISDLKSVIVETFDRLSALNDDELGPAMVKQKHVLGLHLSRGGQ